MNHGYSLGFLRMTRGDLCHRLSIPFWHSGVCSFPLVYSASNHYDCVPSHLSLLEATVRVQEDSTLLPYPPVITLVITRALRKEEGTRITSRQVALEVVLTPVFPTPFTKSYLPYSMSGMVSSFFHRIPTPGTTLAGEDFREADRPRRYSSRWRPCSWSSC